MLKILIVEDDELFAETLRSLVELNPRYQVTAVVSDTDSTKAAVAARHPDIALVDLHLADGESGYTVAAELVEAEVACLFITGRPPQSPLPELALGCLVKPFGEGELGQALRSAEDLLRGRQLVRRRANLPDNLMLYGEAGHRQEPEAAAEASIEGIPPQDDRPTKAPLFAWIQAILKR